MSTEIQMPQTRWYEVWTDREKLQIPAKNAKAAACRIYELRRDRIVAVIVMNTGETVEKSLWS